MGWFVVAVRAVDFSALALVVEAEQLARGTGPLCGAGEAHSSAVYAGGPPPPPNRRGRA
jgi:hypothetical protein